MPPNEKKAPLSAHWRVSAMRVGCSRPKGCAFLPDGRLPIGQKQGSPCDLRASVVKIQELAMPYTNGLSGTKQVVHL